MILQYLSYVKSKHGKKLEHYVQNWIFSINYFSNLSITYILYNGDKVFKSGLIKFCGRHPLKKLKGYIFHKINLAHSWILCLGNYQCFSDPVCKSKSKFWGRQLQIRTCSSIADVIQTLYRNTFLNILLYDWFMRPWCSCFPSCEIQNLHFTGQFNYISHVGGPYHIESSPLICTASQWSVFYMIRTSVTKELIIRKIAISSFVVGSVVLNDWYQG